MIWRARSPGPRSHSPPTFRSRVVARAGAPPRASLTRSNLGWYMVLSGQTRLHVYAFGDSMVRYLSCVATLFLLGVAASWDAGNTLSSECDPYYIICL